jgi:phosphatidate cytidylyltransferase
LEHAAKTPEPPEIRSPQAPKPVGSQNVSRPPGDGRLLTEAAPTGHFSDNDPTAPGLFESPGPEDQYFEGSEHNESFLDDERPGGRNLPQAIVAGVILAGLVLAALWVGAEAMMVLVGAVAVLAAIELYNAMRLAGLRPATMLGLLASASLPIAAFFRGDAAFTLIVCLMVVFGVLWYLAGADHERPVLNLSLTMLGVFWIGGLGAFAGLILRSDEFGIPLLLSTIVIAVTSDTMAYFGGRAFGRRPFHSVSPNKTWEGTMTGFVFAVFVSFAIAVMPFTTMWDGRFLSALLLGAVVGLLTPIGDLAESLVKRDLGVKDMGTIIPGHGGILDRIDGLLFALPGAYYVGLLAGIL